MPERSYVDDPTITKDAALWRRVSPQQVILDKNIGRLRPSSAAFSNSTDGTPMSILFGEIVKATGRKPETILAEYPTFSLTSITAALARQHNQAVLKDTFGDEPSEPAHGYVAGKKTKGVKKAFSLNATWVIAPHPAGSATKDQ